MVVADDPAAVLDRVVGAGALAHVGRERGDEPLDLLARRADADARPDGAVPVTGGRHDSTTTLDGAFRAASACTAPGLLMAGALGVAVGVRVGDAVAGGASGRTTDVAVENGP